MFPQLESYRGYRDFQVRCQMPSAHVPVMLPRMNFELNETVKMSAVGSVSGSQSQSQSHQNACVIVNSGPVTSCPTYPSTSLAGLVIARPVARNSVPRQQKVTPISKILIKACPKGNKKDGKIFSLRNIDPSSVMSVDPE